MLDPEVKTMIDKAINTLDDGEFIFDPVIPATLWYTASIVGKATKRHGHVIQLAIYKALLKHHSKITCWHNRDLTLNKANRRVSLDLLVQFHDLRHLGYYEIKRGNSHHDSGKMRQIKRDLDEIREEFEKVTTTRNHTCSAHAIYFYGKGTIKGSLSRDDLDAHFGLPVLQDVEDANEYFAQKFQATVNYL